MNRDDEIFAEALERPERSGPSKPWRKARRSRPAAKLSPRAGRWFPFPFRRLPETGC